MHLPHNFWNKVVKIGNLFKNSNPLRSIDIFTHQNNLQVQVIAHVKPMSHNDFGSSAIWCVYA